MKRIFLIIILLQVAPCTAAEQNTRYLGSNGFYSSYPQQPQGPLLLLNQQIMNPGYINRFPQIAPQQVNYSVQPNLLPQVTPQQFTYPMQADWLQQAPQQQLIYPEYPPYPAQIDFMPTIATMPLPPAELALLSLLAESSTQIPAQLSLSTDEAQQLTYPGYPPYSAQVDFIQSMPDIPVAPAALALPQHHNNSSRRTKRSTQIPAQLSKRTNRVQKKTRKGRPRYTIEGCGEKWLKDNDIAENDLPDIKFIELNNRLAGETDEVKISIKKARERERSRRENLRRPTKKENNASTNHAQQFTYPVQAPYPVQTDFMPLAPAALPLLEHHNSSSLPAESSTQIPTPLSVSTDDQKKTKRMYLRHDIEECGKKWLENNCIEENCLLDISYK